MPEGVGLFWKVAGVAAFIVALLTIGNAVLGDTPSFPVLGEETRVAYSASDSLNDAQRDTLNRFFGFLVSNESRHVRLNVVLVDSPRLEDREDPLQSQQLGFFRGSHVTFYLGAANRFPGDTGTACQEGPPCPDNYIVRIPDTDGDGIDEGPFFSVVLGDHFMLGAVALGIEKTRTFEDNIDQSGEHPRIRGCFFDVGKIGPSKTYLVTPILLRPAPGECD